MRHTNLWSHLTAFVIGAMLAAGATLALTSDDDSGMEVRDTFTAEVESYFGPEGPQPNVVCFKLEDSPCGLPILGNEDMAVKAGQEVTATEVAIDSAEGEQRIAYHLHPAR